MRWRREGRDRGARVITVWGRSFSVLVVVFPVFTPAFANPQLSVSQVSSTFVSHQLIDLTPLSEGLISLDNCMFLPLGHTLFRPAGHSAWGWGWGWGVWVGERGDLALSEALISLINMHVLAVGHTLLRPV